MTYIVAMNSWLFRSTAAAQQQHAQHQYGKVASGDDEDSLSSTVTASPSKEQQQLLLHHHHDQHEDPELTSVSSAGGSVEEDEEEEQEPQTNRRYRSVSVSFDERQNVYHTNHLYPAEDCPFLWYTVTDYHCFRTANSSLARAIFQTEGGDCPSPLSFTGILENTYLACHHCDDGEALSAAQRARLRHLFRGKDSEARVGLERRSTKGISKDKSRCRSELVRVIHTLQQQQDLPPLLRQKPELGDDPIALAEEMRQQCENVSRGSRLFAQCLAQAQYDVTLLTTHNDNDDNR